MTSSDFTFRQSESAAEWVLLKEWSGQSTAVTTDPFTSAAPVLRITWSATEVTRDGLLDIYVRSKADRRLLGAAVSVRVAERTSGSFEVKVQGGEYLLEIRDTGVKWQVSAAQPRNVQ